jgi:1-acyl-sn-glycerol-3-phosphate acyltransferase
VTGLRSAIYLVCFYLWTVPISFLYLPLLAMPRSAMIPFARLWSKGVLLLMKVIVGIRWKVEGVENLPPKPYILASKHQSAFETFAIPVLIHDPAFVLKQELTWLPFFGWYLAKTGVIAIDRSAGTKALKSMVKGAEKARDDGRAIIIFPEGTRTAPGAKGTYHTGVAMLYGALNIPAVPMAVNSGLCWGKRAFTKHAGEIVFRILPPIAPGMDRKSFMALLETTIETATDELLNAA